MSELFRALGAALEPPGRAPSGQGLAPVCDALELGPPPTPAEHTEAIVFSLYPYASVYLGAEGMIGGEARDRVAGFFRACGVPVSREPDHVTVLLASYASLSESAANEPALANARRALFWEHLMSFLPAYASAMEKLEIEFYARWARLLTGALHAEAAELGPPARLPIHLAQTDALGDDDMGTPDLLMAGLLAPVRSGVILTRRDLVRMARDLSLSARAGERKWVLRALLEQDAPRVIAWLFSEARSWRARHVEKGDVASLVWAERAEHTAELLLARLRPA